MRRREAHTSDPLDLLLDTVCNLFGVIIFIAIVAAILVEPPKEPEVNASVSQVENDLEATPAKTVVIDNPELAEIDRQIKRAKKEIGHRRELISKLQRDTETTSARLGDSTALLVHLEGDVRTITRQIEAATQLKNVPMRTPKAQAHVGKIPVQILLAFGKVYLINDFRGWPSGSKAYTEWTHFMTRWNENSIVGSRSKATFRRDGLLIERRILLRHDGGVAVESFSDLQQSAQWHEQISALDPKLHIVNVAVRPDSFELFGLVRTDLARRGLLYYTIIEVSQGLRYSDRWTEGTPESH